MTDMTDAKLLQDIEGRVRPTICPTFSVRGDTIEGRISLADFEALLDLIGRVRESERERCAALHESVNPASDDERYLGVPGAGAMGAVIEYRDKIRKLR